MYFVAFCALLIWIGVYVTCQDIWHSPTINSNLNNREEFGLTNLTVNQNFTLNLKIKKWRSINLRDKAYAVGLSDYKIALIELRLSNSKKTFVTNTTVIDIEVKLYDVILFENWNYTTKAMDVMVVASTEDKLIWYQMMNSKLVKFWTWPFPHEINHLSLGYNPHENSFQIILGAKETLLIYEFDLRGNYSYWLKQSIAISNPIKSSAVTTYRDGYYLMLPQTSLGSLLIYKYVDRHFIPYKNITSQNIQEVVAFQIDYKSFFAIDGYEKNIYQFVKNTITAENILNSNLDAIKYWFPLTMNNFRQNVILLAQRTLDHGSHKTHPIEIVTYNNGNFEEIEDVPCFIYGEVLSGLNCITTHDSHLSIEYSTFVSMGDVLGLLVPRANSSIMLMMNTILRKKSNPIEEEIRTLNETRRRLQEMIDQEFSDHTTPEPEVVSYNNISQPSQSQTSTLKNTSASYADGKFNTYNNSDTDSSSVDGKPSANKTDSIVGNINLIDLSKNLELIGIEISKMKVKIDQIEDSEHSSKFQRLIVNGDIEVEDETLVDNISTVNIRAESADFILNDLVRRNESSSVIINSSKTFTDLDVQGLNFLSVNGIDAEHIIFKDQTSININGKMIFENPVTVMGDAFIKEQVNDVIYIQEIPNMKKIFNGKLKFDTVNVLQQLESNLINGLSLDTNPEIKGTNQNIDINYVEFDSVIIPENITVNKINGENFDEFIDQLCLKNINTYISGPIIIKGNVKVLQSATTNFLNDLKFPEDYIFLNSGKSLNITGTKIFNDTLTAKEFRINGYIDGHKTDEFITLSTNQLLPTKVIFEDLELTEMLVVDGKIIGEHVNKFLPNPTLLSTSLIKSNVLFTDLEVDGIITIRKHFNSYHLKDTLENIIYEDEPSANITSVKEFPEGITVHKNLILQSKSFNNISIGSIVTTDTNQVLSIPILNGSVNFENLEVTHYFGNVNVTKLDRETVKITGDQYISSVLVFKQDLEVNDLEILDRFNEFDINQLYYTTGDREILGAIEFDEIHSENMHVQHNLTANITEINIAIFNESRLSYTRDQIITEPYEIDSVDIDHLETDSINDEYVTYVYDKEAFMRNIVDYLNSGMLSVKDLVVNGSLNIIQLNGIVVNTTGILKQEERNEESTLIFQGDVFVPHLIINKLGDVDLKHFLEVAVYKNESDLILRGNKIFSNGITVDKIIETNQINNVPVDNLLTKEGQQTISGPLEIYGDVVFTENVELSETLNSVPFQYLNDTFEISDDSFVIKGDILFDRLCYVEHMEIQGHVGEEKVCTFLDDIVYTDMDIKLYELVEFKNTVTIDGNLTIANKLNDIDLSEVASNIVLKTVEDTIESAVTFTQPIYILNEMDVETNMNTRYLFGIDLEQWKTNAIYVDRGLLPGHFQFAESIIHTDLSTNFLNDICMNSTILLKSAQNIRETLQFDKVVFVRDVNVDGLVNGEVFKEVMANTVMVNIPQDIWSEITFASKVLIRNELVTSGTINNRTLDKIVTTDTDQNLTATYNFYSKITLDDDLHISGHMNGINISDWQDKVLKLSSNDSQTVLGDWQMSESLIFEDTITGNNSITNFEVENMLKLIGEKQHMKTSMEIGWMKDYKSVCEDIDFLTGAINKQIYKLKTFDYVQFLNFSGEIQYVHYVEERNILIVNEVNSCSSHVFSLNDSLFTRAFVVNIGNILQMVTVIDNELTYFVIRSSDLECGEVIGTNIWKYANGTFWLIANIENQKLLQESMIPGTFYGLTKYGVSEFRIVNTEDSVKINTKWKIYEDNMAFVPRGLKTGLAMRTGQKLIKLQREDPVVQNDLPGAVETILRGDMTESINPFIPGRDDGDVVVVNVGINRMRKSLLAVAFHEETVVKGKLDFIKIYEDVTTGRLFHKIPTYKPSSLISLELENGETFLMFLEDNKKFMVYEYKGIEGFKHRLSVQMEGTYLFRMKLPWRLHHGGHAVGILNKNRISIIEAMMVGHPSNENIKCNL